LSENVDCGVLVNGIISDVAEVAHSGSSCLASWSCGSGQSSCEQTECHHGACKLQLGARKSHDGTRCLEQDLGERAPTKSSQETLGERAPPRSSQETQVSGLADVPLSRSVPREFPLTLEASSTDDPSRHRPSMHSLCLDGVQGAPSHELPGHQGVASMGGSTSTHGTECLSELLDISRTRPGEESATSEKDTAVGFRPSLLPASRFVDVADVLAVAHETWDTELEESQRITSAYQLEACCTGAVQENSRLLEENEQLRRELDMLLAMTSPLDDTPSSEGSTALDSRVAKSGAASSLAKR